GGAPTGSSTEPIIATTTTVVPDNTPGLVKNGKDLGPVDPATVISVTVWLKLHNEAQLENLVRQQHTKGNPNFHKWQTQAQLDAQFSPTAQELKSVQNFLTAHKLTTLAVADNNWFVKVQGTVADVEKAFHVQLDSFGVTGATFRSNTSNPSINDSSGAHVAAVTGLDDVGFHPNSIVRRDPDGSPSRFPVSIAGPNGFFFESQCFRAPQTHSFTGAAGTARYSGNRFGSDITSSALGHLPPCGYQPRELQTSYGLKALHAQGLDGTGQTVVITDAFGSPTLAGDAATFSQIYGLPPADLTIVRAPGLAQNPHGVDLGWNAETTLDVEWAHAVAPGARIALVVATDRASLDEAILHAVIHDLGNTISNSWSIPEGFGNPAQLGRTERILQLAAAKGVDVNFSSGDDGDDRFSTGFITVEYTGSSTFATSIGGTSLALNADDTIKWQSGWGNNLTRIADVAPANAAVIPPSADPALGLGFQFGAGGGASLTFAKPDFQAGLPGTKRLVPDISLLADPFTGVEIILTDGGALSVEVIGGTSLAAPMFSGLMAIAAQKAGHGLGQAAPLVYGLPAGAVSDIVPVGSPDNVTGVINGAPVSADALAAPLFGTTTYFSAMYNSPFSTRWFVLTFGTDTGLTTAPGWDDVTGVGTPNGAAFVNAIAQ
ncbi:MAG: protease pro-enzyme activation domain-containing protein, partial [Anaeromyxobacteraceae bacterium]